MFPLAHRCSAQSERPLYTRKNSVGILVGYSNDSSHILFGQAAERKLLNIGASYSRRLLANRFVNWQYDGEILPISLNSDPVQVTTSTVTFPSNPPISLTSTTSAATLMACEPASGSGTFPGNGGSYSYVTTCSRRWVMGEAMSPAGFQVNFAPPGKYQPFIVGHAGYIYSSQPIPTDIAGSFNFTVDLGLGLEWYRTRTRSMRAEYRYCHMSNDDSARSNPGIDRSVFQVSYVFGR